MNPTTSKLSTLLGTASFLALSSSLSAHAQQVGQAQMAAAQQSVPKDVLITSSRIRGASAVDAPLTDLDKTDSVTTAASTGADLFKTIRGLNLVQPQGQQIAQAQIERTLIGQAQVAQAQVPQVQ